jgi:acetyl-CoA synthetase
MKNIIINNQYNIGHICTRQQCDLGNSDKIALRWVAQDNVRIDYTFNDLDKESNRFANALKRLEYSVGDVFFTFLPKRPEQFFSILGALKYGLITGTLFPNFGEEALVDRLADAKTNIILTKKSHIRRILKIIDRLPDLKLIIVADIDEDISDTMVSYKRLLEVESDEYETKITDGSLPSLLHYTSGSTGKPKGVLHRHLSVLHQSLTVEKVFNLKSNDIFWCTADLGWVTGTSYGIIGPWSLGITQLHFDGGFNADTWFGLLQDEKVSVWYTAPTALRMLLRENKNIFKQFNLNHLKYIFSVGEPLNPEVIKWCRDVLNKEVYDTWFQTETGGIMIANRPDLTVRSGSMGKVINGIDAAILDDKGCLLENGVQGNLCVKSGWPSMFVTYLNNDQIYQSKFQDDWYYTGDTAYQDEDGYFWFVGRSDDVINTSGHLISPFEVESTLLELDEVAESGVVGVPDEMLYQKVVAYVRLSDTYFFDEKLEMKMKLYVSNRLSTFASPQEIITVAEIPKNKSGKIMRRVLKNKYIGADLGDVSTMDM